MLNFKKEVNFMTPTTEVRIEMRNNMKMMEGLDLKMCETFRDRLKDAMEKETMEKALNNIADFKNKYAKGELLPGQKRIFNFIIKKEILDYARDVKKTIKDDETFFEECAHIRRRYRFALPRYNSHLGLPDNELDRQILEAYKGKYQFAFSKYAEVLANCVSATKQNFVIVI